MKKDLILSMSVVLGVAGVCFGAGFFALAHFIDGSAKTTELAAAKPAEKDTEKNEHGNTAKPLQDGAHGEEKAAPDANHTEKGHDAASKDEKVPSDECRVNNLGTRHSALSAHGEGSDKTATVPASPAILKEIEAHYNDLLARDRFDECRDVAAKAMTMVGHDHTAWQLRLAKATMQSETLPKQQRYVKALQLNADALAQGLNQTSEESARYGSCVCLRQLSRWEELTQGTEAYMKQFKLTVHTPEILLFHALGISAEGRNTDARVELDALTGNDSPDAIRAQAMWHIAQLNLKEAELKCRVPSDECRVNNLGTRHSALSTQDLPSGQWELISRALERSDHVEAQRLFEPYASTAADDQRARMSVKYANLMVKIAANRGAGSDVK